jgi:hypothetical protein
MKKTGLTVETKLFLKAVFVCLLLLIITDLVLWGAKTKPGFYSLFNRQIASREVLLDMLGAYSRGSKPIVLIFGDSVLYGSGMHAHQVPRWQEQTISAFLSRKLPDFTVVDISMDGALPLDYWALYQVSKHLKPAFIIFEFNYRMFAQKYWNSGQAISRPWLLEKTADPPVDLKTIPTAADRITGVLRKGSLLFRYSECARNAIFFPSREEAFNQWLRRLLPAKSIREPEDKDVLLQLKIKPYYFTTEMQGDETPLQAIRLLLKELGEQKQPFLAFFTPQNADVIKEIYNEDAFNKNMQKINASFQRPGRSHQNYVDWSALYPSQAFYDHCHLTPAYNEQLAQALADKILSETRGRNAQTPVE